MGGMDNAKKLARGLKYLGVSGVTRRAGRKLVARLSDALALEELDFPLRVGDIANAEDIQYSPKIPNLAPGKKLHIGWVCIPPGQGSGGHTTFFRMIHALEELGHECTVLLYDRDFDDVSRHEAVIRRGWPWLRANIVSATQMPDELDAVVASSWATAHVLATRRSNGMRCFYFIQDFEPYFYPRGYLYQLAEETYRFGFHTLSLGAMVKQEMINHSGVEPDTVVPFGCDRNTYYLIESGINRKKARAGIVYYAKRSSDRRGYLLAKAALQRFHELNPDQEIHVYGDQVRGWGIPITNHGSLTPEQLNCLYNATIGSLAMSYTNVSLVPGELLAAGNIPVLNESPEARLCLDAEPAVWAQPTAEALAQALSSVVKFADIDGRAQLAARNAPRDWYETEQAVAKAIESGCYGVFDDEPRTELSVVRK